MAFRFMGAPAGDVVGGGDRAAPEARPVALHWRSSGQPDDTPRASK
jgi:hypothetical protein